MYVDGHCHLDLLAFDATRVALVARARAVGVTGFVLAGVDPAGWARQRALCAARDDMWRTVGIHPWAVGVGDVDAVAAALEVAPLPVAIGEIGLDALGDRKASLDAQEGLFRAQLALARERDLPVVLHVVRAHGRALDILRADGLPRAGGVLHRFTGPPGRAGAYTDLGLCVGIARAMPAAATVPLAQLILESDADTPGGREPADIVRVAAQIADLRGIAAAHVLSTSADNARRLYGLA